MSCPFKHLIKEGGEHLTPKHSAPPDGHPNHHGPLGAVLKKKSDPRAKKVQRVPKGVFGEGVFHRAPQGRRNLAKTGGAKPLGGPS